MMSSVTTEGGHGKADVVRDLREFCRVNQFQMRTRGWEGVKKSEIFVNIINVSPLCTYKRGSSGHE